MSDAVIAVIITGVFSVVCQMIISRNSTKDLAKDLYAKLDKQSQISDQKLDAKLEKYQAVTDEKISELTREVRKHNNFAERMPVLEEKISTLEKKVS